MNSKELLKQTLENAAGMRRGYDIICLAPEGFSSQKVANIRQAMCQVEMLLETDALPEIGIEQCIVCGALWNMDEESWLDDLRGGTGILVREPYKAAKTEAHRPRQ